MGYWIAWLGGSLLVGLIADLTLKAVRQEREIKRLRTEMQWVSVEPLERVLPSQVDLSMGDKPESVAAWQDARKREAYVQRIISK